MTSNYRIGLASAVLPRSINYGVEQVGVFLREASQRDVRVVCFPESYLSVTRHMDDPVAPGELRASLRYICEMAGRFRIGVILPMDWYHPDGLLNTAMVISPEGVLLGQQTKNQLDLAEEDYFVAGRSRRIFEVSGLTFGISICHEGFRYPETVRWAAVRGASIVFHPHCAGTNKAGKRLTQWRGPDNPYYEHAMACRAIENEIYFASVNYSSLFQDSASCVIAPDGGCVAFQPYAEPGLLIADIDISRASRRFAMRYDPDRYIPSDSGRGAVLGSTTGVEGFLNTGDTNRDQDSIREELLHRVHTVGLF
ncbi:MULTISPECIES: carbon-nitrogen hydrolase family protein [unclassified Bradyrhizobium]|uniref:carbon-nitrogen hydrolase family protein n=1 Tax=unclassified Bradyrhizobium TaxID=2631580 RepID=UPI0028E2EB24|nr:MULTISPECIES: carbon-nitrogen hydrolase family protein [unclassified Bradyrhizobium]